MQDSLPNKISNDCPEVWKDISGYEGLYQVSSHGRVRSLDRVMKFRSGGIHNGRIISPNVNKNGYLSAHLHLDGAAKLCLIHRLVGEAFIQKISGKDCINHIDHDRSNNYLDNLEWVTHSENSIHAIKHGRWSKNTFKRSIICLNNGKSYESIKAASEDLGLLCPGISNNLSGKLKSIRGYKFKYA